MTAPSDDEKRSHFAVQEHESDQRLDRFLAQKLSEVGRKLAGQLCETGKVRVNGSRAKKSFLLQSGMEVTVSDLALGRALPAPDLKLSLLLVTDDLVIVDKAPGVPCGALPGSEEDTVAGGLIARFPEMTDVGFSPREPGIIHRLDNQTSGLLLAARNQETFNHLRKGLVSSQIEKRYLAIVEAGSLPTSGVINKSLENNSQDRRSVRIAAEGRGRKAETQFVIIEETNGLCLVEVTANRAFRHQIRVHLAHLGAPLVGDVLYGGRRILSPRHALHASYIAWAGEHVPSFRRESSLADDLRCLLDSGLPDVGT